MRRFKFKQSPLASANLAAVALLSLLSVSCNQIEAQKGTLPYREVITANSSITSAGGEVGLSQNVIVRLADKRNNGIQQLSPSIVAVDGSGVPVAGITYGGCSGTDTNGNSTCTINSAVAGTYTLRVTAPVKFSGGSATFTQIARTLEFTTNPSATSVAGVAFAAQPVVKIKDRVGVDMAAATNPITLALTNANGATLSGTATVSAVAGTATFAGLSVNLIGTYTLTASVAGATGGTSASFVINAAAASALAFATQPSATSSANNAFAQQPIIAVKDALGNTVTTSACAVRITLTTKPSVPDSLSGTFTKTASSGIANFAGTSLRVTTGSGGTGYILTASGTGACAGLTPGTSLPFEITQVGVPSQLALMTTPGTPSLGETWDVQPIVHVLDFNGNLAGTDNATIVSIAKSSGPAGLLTGPTSVQVVNGVATFSGLSVTSNNPADAGGYVFDFDAVSSTNPGFDFAVASTTVNVTANGLVGAALLFQVQPANVAIGQPVPTVEVKIVDSNGYLCRICTNTIVLGNYFGAGVMTGTTSRVAASGVATFPGISYSQASSKQMDATSAGLTSAYSNIFAVSNYGLASKLAFSSQPSRTSSVGSAAWNNQPVVQVQDSAGNLVVNDNSTVVMLACAFASSACDLQGTPGVQAVNGVATFTGLRTQQTGLTNIVLQADGTSGTTGPLIATQSNSFNGNPGIPTSLEFSAQPSSGGATGLNPWSNQPVIVVKDASGNTITTDNSTTVTVACVAGVACNLNGTQVLTAVNGVVSFTDLRTAQTGLTGIKVSASASGLTPGLSNSFNGNAP